MTEREKEINALIAVEFCGWCHGDADNSDLEWLPPIGRWRHPDGRYCADPPDYLHSLDCCSEFEAVIAQRGINAIRAYHIVLKSLLPPAPLDIEYPGHSSYEAMEMFILLTCPPSLRVEAALRSAGLWVEEGEIGSNE